MYMFSFRIHPPPAPMKGVLRSVAQRNESVRGTKRKSYVTDATIPKIVAVHFPASTVPSASSPSWHIPYTQKEHAPSLSKGVSVFVWLSWRRDAAGKSI